MKNKIPCPSCADLLSYNWNISGYKCNKCTQRLQVGLNGENMKGILEFDLPEENEEFKLAQHGIKYKIAIEDIGNMLRQYYKYADLPDDQSDFLI